MLRDLGDYQNLTAIRGEVVVQFWLRLGDEPVQLEFVSHYGSANIPQDLGELFSGLLK